MAEYATLVEAKAWVGITGEADTINDDEMTIALAAAHTAVNDFCKRRFDLDASASARQYDPPSQRRVHVDDFDPATAITLETDEDDDGVFETTWTVTTDFVRRPPNAAAEGRPFTSIRATGTRLFPRNDARPTVQLTAKWGWPAVPGAVKEATLLFAARYFKRKDAPFGVAGFGEFGDVRIREDTDIGQLLTPYRKLLVA